jgi:hypothetical protein
MEFIHVRQDKTASAQRSLPLTPRVARKYSSLAVAARGGSSGRPKLDCLNDAIPVYRAGNVESEVNSGETARGGIQRERFLPLGEWIVAPSAIFRTLSIIYQHLSELS